MKNLRKISYEIKKSEKTTDFIKSVVFKRILAFVIDFWPLCFLVSFVVSHIVEKMEITAKEFTDSYFYIVMLIVTIIMLLKDFGGASIGKRIMRIRVVDENNETPPLYKLVLRNLISLVWFVQAYYLLQKKTGLNDILTKTKVVER